MLQQIVVIKISMNNSKSRTKAMKIAVSTPGVVSVKLHGDSMDKIVVTGVGIDTTNLTVLIRKKVGFTELVSVQTISKQEDEEEEEDTSTVHYYRSRNEQSMGWTPSYQYSA
ncbi:hypothetical protein AQUCO_00100762v1, partial [Aquilegia coerulea]